MSIEGDMADTLAELFPEYYKKEENTVQRWKEERFVEIRALLGPTTITEEVHSTADVVISNVKEYTVAYGRYADYTVLFMNAPQLREYQLYWLEQAGNEEITRRAEAALSGTVARLTCEELITEVNTEADLGYEPDALQIDHALEWEDDE